MVLSICVDTYKSVFFKEGKFMKKVKLFYKDVKKEISKIKWPNNKSMVKYTITTVSFVIFFALFFTAIDLLIALIRSIGA